jgi:hypothetical protein
MGTVVTLKPTGFDKLLHCFYVYEKTFLSVFLSFTVLNCYLLLILIFSHHTILQTRVIVKDASKYWPFTLV